jgi:hypothetical protein
MSYEDLFDEELQVVNIGLDTFRETLETVGTPVAQVDWNPPDVDPELNRKLTKISEQRDEIAAANRTAVERMMDTKPIWTDVETARDVIPDFDGRTLLHAGPPISWDEMSGPLRGAVIGATMYEGWAETPDEARELAAEELEFSPCHEHQAVGPMTGVISPSMPVAIVENEVHGNRSFSNLNEGLGEVLRFGAFSDEVLERLQWMEAELAPVLKDAVRDLGGVNLKLITAQALQMGDEVHNRNVAATSRFARKVAPGIVRSDRPEEQKAEVAQFLDDNDHFFLNMSMAASKAAADAAAGVPRSTVLTAMTRNGTEFGIRISGLEDAWFTAPAPTVDGLYFPEYTEEDANPDIGDSTIAETTGVGGFAMGAAPAITQFVGGTPQDALSYTREMYEITVEENANFTIPYLNFQGTPTGIDLLEVLDTGIMPFINTGIAHREPGVGQIGAGMVRAPEECFVGAAAAYCDRYLGSAPE